MYPEDFLVLIDDDAEIVEIICYCDCGWIDADFFDIYDGDYMPDAKFMAEEHNLHSPGCIFFPRIVTFHFEYEKFQYVH